MRDSEDQDPFERLRRATPARVALGRCGHGLPTAALLEFQLAHARARDAVHQAFEPERVAAQMPGLAYRVLSSRAPDRRTYLQRPDLGRQLAPDDVTHLCPGDYDAAFVVADGLSATAVHTHAAPVLRASLEKLATWKVAPLILARQARVALGDEIGERLGAALVIVLIGERPGLSSPDSLGCYITWQPRRGRQDSERNCISNIRPGGLEHGLAAKRLVWLITAAHRLRLTGVGLKDASDGECLPAPAEASRSGPRVESDSSRSI